MDNLLRKLNINETFTKEIRGIKFDKVKQNTYPKVDIIWCVIYYIYQALNTDIDI